MFHQYRIGKRQLLLFYLKSLYTEKVAKRLKNQIKQTVKLNPI